MGTGRRDSDPSHARAEFDYYHRASTGSASVDDSEADAEDGNDVGESDSESEYEQAAAMRAHKRRSIG